MAMALEYSTIFNPYTNLKRVQNISRSPALQVAVLYGISGVVFAVSNLMLARYLPKIEFALVTLFLAMVQISMPIGMGGVEVIVNRKKLDPSVYLLKRVLLTASVIGGLTISIGYSVYNIKLGLLLILLFIIIIGSSNSLAAHHFQSMQKFGLSLCLSQSSNLSLAIAAGATFVMTITTAWIPCAIIAAGYAVSATLGWTKLFRNSQRTMFSKPSISWIEAATILGFNGALLIMVQLERLIVPKVLSIEKLATLGVLMTVAGFPFSVLGLGIRLSMLPRFRDANKPAECRRLLAKEGTIVLFVAITASIVVWLLAPVLVKWFLSGKYDISRALVMAAIIAGFAKLFDAFASTVATALGSLKVLSLLSFLSWISLAISVIGAFIGARWGLEGVIYGVGFGWFFRALMTSILSKNYFRLPART